MPIACMAALVALLILAIPFPVCRDWAFIDENTASRKGYREWFFGLRTGDWYRPSAVEMFMRAQHPGDLKQRWTSYAGTGRNFFGAKVLYGHSRPGAIIRVNQHLLKQWFDGLSETEKLAFYNLLVSDDQEAIGRKIDSIYEAPANAPPQ